MKIRSITINLFYPIFLFVKKYLLTKPQLRVLMFHYVEKNRVKKFEKLIFELKSNFKILTPNEFEDIVLGKKKILKDSILLSFDDGYKSQFNVAKKILNKYKIKALFFITLNFIKMNTKTDIKKFLQYNLKVNSNLKENFHSIKNMTINDVNILLKKGHKIGAHTINHSDLPSVSIFEQKNEIVSFKNKVFERFKIKNIKHFAFTFGEIKNMDFNSLMIASKNYQFLHTGLRGNNNKFDNKIIFRDNCDLHLSLKEIFFFLYGFGDFYYLFRRLKIGKIIKKIKKNK